MYSSPCASCRLCPPTSSRFWGTILLAIGALAFVLTSTRGVLVSSVFGTDAALSSTRLLFWPLDYNPHKSKRGTLHNLPQRQLSTTTTAAGFRKNPHKVRPTLTQRLQPVWNYSGFALLAGIQLYLFGTLYYTNPPRVTPADVGLRMDSLGDGSQVWRVLTADTAHFDLWHIGLNLSAFYNLTPAVQQLYQLSPVDFVGLNLSFIVCVAVVWAALQYGLHWQRATTTTTTSLPSTPTVGYSGVLFALSTMVILRQSQSCPLPLLESVCFPTVSLGAVPVSLAPLAQLGLVQVLLPRVSFSGHLAGILVGYAYTWGRGRLGVVPGTTWYPSLVWPAAHGLYLSFAVPLLRADRSTTAGRRLVAGDSPAFLGWVRRLAALRDVQIAVFVVIGSGVCLGWTHALVWSYALSALFWAQNRLVASSTTESGSSAVTTLTWKRAYCVHAVVLFLTLVATMSAEVFSGGLSGWTVPGLVAIGLQAATLCTGVIHVLDDVSDTEGIFFHTLGWTILQPLQKFRSTWRASRVESQAPAHSFPGEGRRLREVEAEMV